MDVAPLELETFFQRRSINITLLRSERDPTCVETSGEHARTRGTRGMNLVGKYAEPFFHRAFSSISPVLPVPPMVDHVHAIEICSKRGRKRQSSQTRHDLRAGSAFQNLLTRRVGIFIPLASPAPRPDRLALR